jgi:hypothetical protein
MREVGLREMRQNANNLLRRAQAGEQVMITVAGRPVAVSPRAWRRWDDLADIFNEPYDTDWAHDRDLLDDCLAVLQDSTLSKDVLLEPQDGNLDGERIDT